MVSERLRLVEDLHISHFNGYVQVLIDARVICKFCTELPMLHQVTVKWCRGLQLREPGRAFQHDFVAMVLVPRSPQTRKLTCRKLISRLSPSFRWVPGRTCVMIASSSISSLYSSTLQDR